MARRHRLVVVGDVGATWQMMRQGLGIAWLPAWAGLTDLREGRAIELLRDRRTAEVPIFAVRLGFRSDSGLAQLAALRVGLGVGICQLPLAARDPTLERLVPNISGELEVWVVSHANLRGTRRVRACINALERDLAVYAST